LTADAYKTVRSATPATPRHTVGHAGCRRLLGVRLQPPPRRKRRWM